MRSRLCIPIVAGLSLTSLAVAAPLALRAISDYETLPPDPAAVHARMSTFGATLTDACEAAKRAVEGGLVTQAQLVMDGDAPRYEVEIVSATQRARVTVASDGTAGTPQILGRFPGAPVTGEPTTTESGLMYYDMVVGEGESPAGPETTVTVHYTGWLIDGTRFDSSHDRGEPSTYPLNIFIAGWIEGVGSMKVGGKRKLIIPYDLAYGEGGRRPLIPPRATLVFDIELIALP